MADQLLSYSIAAVQWSAMHPIPARLASSIEGNADSCGTVNLVNFPSVEIL
jgi:hypothetical protein